MRKDITYKSIVSAMYLLISMYKIHPVLLHYKISIEKALQFTTEFSFRIPSLVNHPWNFVYIIMGVNSWVGPIIL
jgi:hypothetical protein